MARSHLCPTVGAGNLRDVRPLVCGKHPGSRGQIPALPRQPREDPEGGRTLPRPMSAKKGRHSLPLCLVVSPGRSSQRWPRWHAPLSHGPEGGEPSARRGLGLRGPGPPSQAGAGRKGRPWQEERATCLEIDGIPTPGQGTGPHCQPSVSVLGAGPRCGVGTFWYQLLHGGGFAVTANLVHPHRLREFNAARTLSVQRQRQIAQSRCSGLQVSPTLHRSLGTLRVVLGACDQGALRRRFPGPHPPIPCPG